MHTNLLGEVDSWCRWSLRNNPCGHERCSLYQERLVGWVVNMSSILGLLARLIFRRLDDEIAVGECNSRAKYLHAAPF